MVAGNKLLLESVSAAVRKKLVRERVLAMRGQAEKAICALDQAAQLMGVDRPRDAVALWMLRAELLHLNRQDQEALQQFRDRIVPLKQRLDTEEQFVVEQNLADLEFSAWSHDAGKTFYSLVDRRRLAGYEWFDAQDILEAQEAAAKNEHYESLPIIWRHAVRAYLQGCWLSSRWAAKRLASESLQLGSLVDAAYYAATAPTEDLIEPVSAAIMRRRDVNLVRDLVRRLLGTANLRRHFSLACELIYELGNYLPDDDLPKILAWLLPRCREMPDGSRINSALNMAWKGIEPIGRRLVPDLARLVLETAFAHQVWTTKLDHPNALIIEREQMVKTVNHLVEAVNLDDLPWVASESLPLALDRQQIHDYPKVVNLLCHIAARGGPPLKDQIGAALFPPGRQLDRMLIQVASLFKTEGRSAEQVAALADQLAREIRLQVQFVEAGQQPVQVPETIMTQNQPMVKRTRVVSIVGGVGLHALARHRDLLSNDALNRLVDAILEMVSEPENFLSNRRMLLYGLRQFADCVGESPRQKIFDAILPIARGEIREPTGISSADAKNPLNPNKMNIGDPDQIQTTALVTLAEFSRGERTFTRRLLPILEEAVYAPSPELRRGVFATVARLPKLPDSLLLAVLTGAQDPDPDVSAASFFPLAKQPTWVLKRNHWRIFLHGLRLASQSPHEQLRCNAAWAAAVWAGRAPTKAVKARLEAILAQFRQDISAKVREAAQSPRSTDSPVNRDLPVNTATRTDKPRLTTDTADIKAVEKAVEDAKPIEEIDREFAVLATLCETSEPVDEEQLERALQEAHRQAKEQVRKNMGLR
jgi:hypothetical protein